MISLANDTYSYSLKYNVYGDNDLSAVSMLTARQTQYYGAVMY